MDEINSIEIYRKKQKKEKRKRRIIVILVILILVCIFIGAGSVIKSMNESNALPVYDESEINNGFPITMPTSAGYTMNLMDGDISLLTDTTLYVYNSAGSRIFSYSHIDKNPMMQTAGKRTLVYDSGGKKFAVATRKKVVFEKELTDDITFAQIGADGKSAVITESDRYSAVLRIFSRSGEEIFTWSSTEKILSFDFTYDNNGCFVSTASTDKGKIVSVIYKFSFKNAESADWSYTSGGTLAIRLKSHSNGSVTVTGDNSVFVVKDGNLENEYKFTLPISAYSASEDVVSVLLSDSENRKSILLAFNISGKLLGEASIDADSADIFADKSDIYVLEEKKIEKYNSSLASVSQYTLDSEYNKLKIYKDHFYLLSDTIIGKVGMKADNQSDSSSSSEQSSDISSQ